MDRFSGKVALVSGAARGIGAAVVERLRSEGAEVVGGDVAAVDGGVVLDVTDEASCAAAVATTLERHGRLDVLANVAGILQSRPIEEMSVDLWRRIIDVNLTGAFLLTQAALPALLDGGGVIVNMASASGLRATPYNTAYCASKGGLIMFTKSLAIELAKRGVLVELVVP